jgi:gluconate 2-dehydrogenase gamma chain
MSREISRRDFVATAGALGAAAAVPGSALAQHAHAPAPTPAGAAPGAAPAAGHVAPEQYVFLNQVEAAFVEAAVARLIPADDRDPGALEAGVPIYIDRQLAGAYGSGARMYLDGPWQEGTPGQGYQLPYTPAQLYRTAIAGIAKHVASTTPGKTFRDLAPADQDKLLQALEDGDLVLPNVPSAVFFETLLANTIEGFFADPIYGGNRGMAGWRMVGFPGAYAAFALEVDKHNVKFTREPMSIAQANMGPTHMHD